MSSILAEKYADLLSSEDVSKLFNNLEKALGSRTEAARICRLERKTTYDWEKTDEIRLRTKRRVLRAFLDSLPEEALKFMTERSVEKSVDILRIFLSAIYEGALNEQISREEFQRLTSKFEDIKRKYAGLILDNLEVEVGDMCRSLSEKGSDLGLTLPESPSDVVRLSKLSRVIPTLIRAISVRTPLTADPEIAKDLNFPLEFVQSLSRGVQESYPISRQPSDQIQPIRPMERWLDVAGTITSEIRLGERREVFSLTEVSRMY